MAGWSKETAATIAAHCKDFNNTNYAAEIQKRGGYFAYIDSLGGVFLERHHNAGKAETVEDFRHAVDYVAGLMAIWGFDYNSGSNYYRWKDGGPDRFYLTGKGACNGGSITELCTGKGGKGRTTNCNYGIDTVLRTMGLYKSQSCNFVTWATKYGRPVSAKKDLQPGDMVHFYNKKPDRTKPATWKNKGWKHIAIVYAIEGGRVCLADFGSRFIKSGSPFHYMPIDTSATAGGEYGSSYWTAVHAFNFKKIEKEETVPMLNGIDMASYQAGLDFSKTPADFAIIKATEGTGYVNPDCNRAYANAKKNGVLVGLYHYANGGNPEAEADYFINSISNYIGSAVLALDWERANNPAFGKNDVAWCRAWLDRVYKRTKVRPLIYMSQSVTTAHNWQSVAKDTGLWVAQYVVESRNGYRQDYGHAATGAWNYPAIFQYTSGGYLPGWSARLDLDVAYMDRAAWAKYARGDRQNGAGTAQNTEAPVYPSTIKKGDTGAAVRMLQAFLGGLKVDGGFGANTDKAVRAWQKAHGLKVDGVVGPKTWRAILSVA